MTTSRNEEAGIRLAAEIERLRAENAELRCRVDELTEENKLLTSERAELLVKLSDAHAELDNQPSWGSLVITTIVVSAITGGLAGYLTTYARIRYEIARNARRERGPAR